MSRQNKPLIERLVVVLKQHYSGWLSDFWGIEADLEAEIRRQITELGPNEGLEHLPIFYWRATNAKQRWDPLECSYADFSALTWSMGGEASPYISQRATLDQSQAILAMFLKLVDRE
jgi:hypothetical protein